MNSPKKEPPQGVYYHSTDSPGFLVRVGIDLLDALIIAAIIGIAIGVAVLSFPDHGQLRQVCIIASFVLVWIYMVPIKRSTGTLGYIVFGIKVVNLQGERPSLLQLTGRTIAPLIFNTLVDLVYLTSDSSRQALRDKVTGTYLIKHDARPAGQGDLVWSRTCFYGWNVVYREVKRRE